MSKFVGKVEPLTKKQSKILMRLVLSVQSGHDPELTEYPLASQIIKKRIEVLKLPIKFTPSSYLAASIFVKSPGAAVIFLIDALTKFEGQTLTVNKICEDLYPWGFYTETSLEDYVDNYLKPSKVKWAEIY